MRFPVLLTLLLGCTGEAPVDDTGSEPRSAPELVDADAYFGRLEALVAAAADRLAGSEAEADARDWARAELEALGWTVEEQPFSWGVPLRTTANLVATSPFGTPDEVVAMGAHLDSVAGVSGVNDNGTGVAAVLEVAQALSLREEPPVRQVKVVLFSWEESGLLGSQVWVANQVAAEDTRLRAFVNVDMIGSPNGYPMLMDPSGYGGDDAFEAGSEALNAAAAAWIASEGAPWRLEEASPYSDHLYVLDFGVPIAYLLAGGSDQKTEEEAAAWGGTAGEPYDACYHTPCDDLGNVDLELAVMMTRATAAAIEAAADGAIP